MIGPKSPQSFISEAIKTQTFQNVEVLQITPIRCRYSWVSNLDKVKTMNINRLLSP